MLPFALQEPLRWINLITTLNEYMKFHDILLTLVPITADIFVFLFPILLIIIYVVWLMKNNDKIKESALWVFWSAIITSAINVCIQFFFIKSRPSVLLFGNAEEETLLHKFLPNSSFPSDHAAMSMWFWLGLLIRWIRNKDKTYIRLWILFLIFAIITGFSRVMVWVHRPTDILWWFAVWIIVPLILSLWPVYNILKKILIDPLIKFQNWVRWLFSKK